MDELSSASERGSVASKEQAAAMVLSILPKVDAGMEVDIETLSYKLVHTCPIIQLLQSQAPDLDLAGTTSPLNEVTLPDEVKALIGMPQEAAWFAFLYPIKGLTPNKQLRREAGAMSFLIGGFLYFDAGKRFLQFNALALKPSAVSLSLSGPYDGSQAFATALEKNDRLATVTIAELRAGGFRKFAWVHPSEKLDGDSLGAEPYEHGSFVYIMDGVDNPQYYPVLVKAVTAADAETTASNDDACAPAPGGLGGFFSGMKSLFEDDLATVKLDSNESIGTAASDVSVEIQKASMSLSILPNIELELTVDVESCTLLITGPDEKLDSIRMGLKEHGTEETADSFLGTMSPLSPVTLPDEAKEGVGIPLETAYFAYAYALGQLEEALEQFNLAAQPWAFFLLCGGFLYFDESKKLLAINAVALAPSPYKLDLKGPFHGNEDFAAAMGEKSRLASVTVDALQSAGFLQLAWVHPAEQVDEHSLGDEPYPHGAFMYKVQVRGKDEPQFDYYPVLVRTKEEIAGDDDVTLGTGDAVVSAALGPLGNYYSNLRKNMVAESQKADQEQQMMDLMVGESKVGKQLNVWQLSLVIYLIMTVFLTVSALFAIAMGSIAYGNDLAYSMLSTLVWGSCYSYVVWVPMRDTCSMALGEKPLRIFGWVFGTGLPIFASVLNIILNSAGTGNVVLRSNVPFIIYYVYVFMLSIMLPLLIYLVRMQQARVVTTSAVGRKNRLLHIVTVSETKDADAATKMAETKEQKSLLNPAWLERRKAETNRKRKKGFGTRQERLQLMKQAALGPLSKADRERLRLLSVIAIQSHARMMIAKYKTDTDAMEKRAERLRYFSYSMYFISVFIALANPILEQLALDSEATYEALTDGSLRWLRVNLWAILLIPGVAVVLLDMRRAKTITYSHAHCAFLMTVLLGTTSGVFALNLFIWDACEKFVYEQSGIFRTLLDLVGVLTIGSTINIGIISVQVFVAKSTLALSARKNSRSYYLFPLLFFQSCFKYAFYDCRKLDDSVTASWFFMTLITNASSYARDAGFFQPATEYAQRKLATLGKSKNAAALAKRSSRSDPLFVLHNVAELGIMYDLAEFIACGVTPCIVTFFIMRDGYFSLYGTGQLVTSCQITQLWLRFFFLLIIKAIMAKLAQCTLAIYMRKTLLAQTTWHGTSGIAAELVAHHNLVKGAVRNPREDDKVKKALLRKYLSAELVDAEELKTVESDFDFSNLNFKTMWVRTIRKHVFFFLAAVILQVVNVYQVTGYVPSVGSPLIQIANAHKMAAIEAGCTTRLETIVNASLLDDLRKTPLQVAWTYQKTFALAMMFDPKLEEQAALRQIMFPRGGLVCDTKFGWDHDRAEFLLCNETKYEIALASNAPLPAPGKGKGDGSNDPDDTGKGDGGAADE